MSHGSDEWYDGPRASAGIKLFRIREELREKNLHDTEEPPLETSATAPAGDVYNVRTADGTYNDLKCPRMGSAGIRFGRGQHFNDGAAGRRRLHSRWREDLDIKRGDRRSLCRFCP